MELEIVFDFLKDLANNNNREWFSQNRESYELARKEAEKFVEQIILAIQSFDPQIPVIQTRKCFYRINRDARFLEENEGPYKENLGAYISKGGKRGPYSAYYIHFEPGASFLSGGIYWAEPPILRALRDEIYFNQEEFINIVSNQEFIRLFHKVEGDSLKNVPRKYPSDHPAAEYLKMKNFTVTHFVDDAMFCRSSFPQFAIEVFRVMSPLNQFLNNAIDNI